MNYKRIRLHASAVIIFAIHFSVPVKAQPYTGGINAGAIASLSATINCMAARFSGGIHQGSASFATTLINCTSERFLGDSADGSSQTQTDLFDCTPLRFAGDSSHGAIAIATQLLLCTNERFRGDTADGYAAAKHLLIRNFLGNDTSAIIICSESTFNLLTLYTTPANLSYNWSSPTPTSTGMGIYTLIATNQSGCVDTAQATIQQEIAIWNGSNSNNWHTAANWHTGKVPSELTHVIIPGGTPHPCQVSDADASAASVQARASGSFSIINNRLLFISGNCAQLPTGQ